MIDNSVGCDRQTDKRIDSALENNNNKSVLDLFTSNFSIKLIVYFMYIYFMPYIKGIYYPIDSANFVLKWK